MKTHTFVADVPTERRKRALRAELAQKRSRG
jgi:hypothetical protein